MIFDDPFDLDLHKDKARFAAELEDEPYAVVGGPHGFEVYKLAHARKRYPELIWFEVEPAH